MLASKHNEKKISKCYELFSINLFNYLGFYVAFNTVQVIITTGSWKGRGNQYIQFVRVLYCKLPTNGKQLPAFPLEAMPGTEPRPQRWEARVLPLCHHGPYFQLKAYKVICNYMNIYFMKSKILVCFVFICFFVVQLVPHSLQISVTRNLYQ